MSTLASGDDKRTSSNVMIRIITISIFTILSVSLMLRADESAATGAWREATQEESETVPPHFRNLFHLKHVEKELSAFAQSREIGEEILRSEEAKIAFLDGIVSGFGKNSVVKSRVEEEINGVKVLKVKSTGPGAENTMAALLLCAVSDGKLVMLSVVTKDVSIEWDDEDLDYLIERLDLGEEP